MATQVLKREDVFPVGTSVSAYAVVGRGETPSSGAPPGAAVDTKTVQSGGVLTFTTLADATSYIAYAASPDRYLRFRTPAAASTSSALTVVTSLPDGLVTPEVYWNVDDTNGVMWHMRYDVTSGKWRFLGGPPLEAEVATSETTASTSYVSLATAGPSIALPGVGGGVYDLMWGCAGANSVAAGFNYMTPDFGGAGASDNDAAFWSAGNSNMAQMVTRQMRKTFAAQMTVAMKHKVSANTGTFSRRWMKLTPVIVNPT